VKATEMPAGRPEAERRRPVEQPSNGFQVKTHVKWLLLTDLILLILCFKMSGAGAARHALEALRQGQSHRGAILW